MANALAVIKQELFSPAIQENIKARLGEKSGTFVTSVLDLFGDDPSLSACDPKMVVKEAMKAAGLGLPINKNLGFAHIIAYNENKKVGNEWKKTMTPHFQMGYKGFIQLALRTGQYRYLNVGSVFEGEEVIIDRIRGTIELGGEKKSETSIGYFCYMELLNGFQKAIFWTRKQVEAHRDKYSSGYKAFKAKLIKKTPWDEDFDGMALKTMILQLVPKYGPMSIEMAQALSGDRETSNFDAGTSIEIENNANSEVIDIPTEGGMTDVEKAEIEAEEKAHAQEKKGPDF